MIITRTMRLVQRSHPEVGLAAEPQGVVVGPFLPNHNSILPSAGVWSEAHWNDMTRLVWKSNVTNRTPHVLETYACPARSESSIFSCCCVHMSVGCHLVI